MAHNNTTLEAWVDEALNLGFGSFNDGDHVPFILWEEASGKQHLINLETTDGEINAEIVEAGRDLIRQFAGGKFYALVWDGFLTTARNRQDAVLVEVGECDGESFVIAQRYKQSRSGALSKVGKPIIAAEADHLWNTEGL